MPVFVQSLVTWSRRHPLLALLLGGVVGWLFYVQVKPPVPRVHPVVAKAQTVPGLGAERAVMEKTLLDAQHDAADLKQTVAEQARVLHQMQQTITAMEQDRKAERQAQEQRMDEFLKRAQQTQTARAAPPAPKAQ